MTETLKERVNPSKHDQSEIKLIFVFGKIGITYFCYHKGFEKNENGVAAR